MRFYSVLNSVAHTRHVDLAAREQRAAHMGMADCDRQRVRGVVGLGNLCKVQDQLRHLLHLLFLRAAVADHALLDLQRRVLRDLQRVFLRRQDQRAARLPDSFSIAIACGFQRCMSAHVSS